MKINNCSCGRKADTRYVGFGSDRVYVYCTRYEEDIENDCWTSPVRETEREAIKAWNKIMKKRIYG